MSGQMQNPNNVPIRYFGEAAFKDLADGICEASGKEPQMMHLVFKNGRTVSIWGAVQRSEDGDCQWIYLRSLTASDYWEIVDRAVPMQIGIDHRGWYSLRQEIFGRIEGNQFLDEVIIEIPGRAEDGLPPVMELSEYDLGHEVVIVTGEQMGRHGRVVASAGGYVIEGGHSVRAEALRAVRSGNLERDIDLAPLRVRLPPGAPVWVPFEERWAAGVVGEYRADSASVWLTEQKVPIALPRDRTKIQPREGTQPPPWNGFNARPKVAKSPFAGARERLMIVDETAEFDSNFVHAFNRTQQRMSSAQMDALDSQARFVVDQPKLNVNFEVHRGDVMPTLSLPTAKELPAPVELHTHVNAPLPEEVLAEIQRQYAQIQARDRQRKGIREF